MLSRKRHTAKKRRSKMHASKHPAKHHPKKTAKKHKKSKRGLSLYQKFMKNELRKMANSKLSQPEKFKKIAALWKKK